MLSWQKFLAQPYSPQSTKTAAHPRNTLSLCGGPAHVHQCNTFRICQNLCVCMLWLWFSFPNAFDLSRLLLQMTVTVIKFPGIPSKCKSKNFCLVFASLPFSPALSQTHTYKEPLLSTIHKRKPDKQPSNHYFPRGLRTKASRLFAAVNHKILVSSSMDLNPPNSWQCQTPKSLLSPLRSAGHV